SRGGSGRNLEPASSDAVGRNRRPLPYNILPQARTETGQSLPSLSGPARCAPPQAPLRGFPLSRLTVLAAGRVGYSVSHDPHRRNRPRPLPAVGLHAGDRHAVQSFSGARRGAAPVSRRAEGDVPAVARGGGQSD